MSKKQFLVATGGDGGMSTNYLTIDELLRFKWFNQGTLSRGYLNSVEVGEQVHATDFVIVRLKDAA